MTANAIYLVVPIIISACFCLPAVAADAMIWGTVEDVARNEVGGNIESTVRIRVENSHGPRDPNVGELITVRVPATSGQDSIPKKGQFIRAHLNRIEKKTYEGVPPYWFHELVLNDDQRAAMKWVQSIPKGYLDCDDDLPGRPIVLIDVYRVGGAGVRDEHLRHLAAFPELRSLNIGFSSVTAQGLRESVAPLPKLEKLNLTWTRMSDESFSGLAKMTRLRVLGVSATRLSDRSMAIIAGNTSLRSLNLGGTNITSAGLAQLTPLQRLEDLKLTSVRIADNAMDHIAKLKSLKRLSLEHSFVSDAGLRKLATLSDLEELNLEDCRITGEGLAHLSSLGKLRKLNLHGTRVDNTSMEAVAKLSQLSEVNLVSTKVTNQGLQKLAVCQELRRVTISPKPFSAISVEHIKQFQKALPKARVVRDYYSG